MRGSKFLLQIGLRGIDLCSSRTQEFFIQIASRAVYVGRYVLMVDCSQRLVLGEVEHDKIFSCRRNLIHNFSPRRLLADVFTK